MFRYIKTQYENIYEWDKSEEGTCFYCKQDKDIKCMLIGEKGICEECLNNFEIGRLGTDRHVIDKITPTFKNARDCINWFKRNTPYTFKKVGDTSEVYMYDCIYDEAYYNKYFAMMKEDGIVPATEKFFSMSDRIEFNKDGTYHIIY